MANEVTTTVGTTRVLTEIIEEMIGPFTRESSIMMPLIKVRSIEGVPTKQMAFPIFGNEAQTSGSDIDVDTVTEGTAITNNAVALSEKTISVTQYAIKTEIMDLAQKSSVGNLTQDIARECMAQLMDKFEALACALLSGFSNEVADSGANLTISDLLSAVTTFRINAKAAARSGVMVLYPQQVADAVTDAIGASTGLAPALSNDQFFNLLGSTPSSAVLGSQAGSFMGVPVLQSTHVPATQTGANSAGAIFSAGEAIGAVMKWDPTLEFQRSTVLGQIGTSLLTHWCFGVGELRDLWGVTIRTDR